jgi:hypothetical protein
MSDAIEGSRNVAALFQVGFYDFISTKKSMIFQFVSPPMFFSLASNIVYLFSVLDF